MLVSWQPYKGMYLHTCDECNEEFYGRKNRLYCTSTCKAKHNNGIAAEKRINEMLVTDAYLRNLRILGEEMNGCEYDVITRPVANLKSKGFDENAPSVRINLNGEIWFKVGHHAFHPLEESKEVKIQKLHDNG